MQAAQNNVSINAYNQQMAAQMHQHTIAGLGRSLYENKRYMIDGVPMDFDEFINALFPEDCAERTYLILKLKGKENDSKST